MYSHSMTVKTGSILGTIAKYILITLVIFAVIFIIFYKNSKKIKIAKRIKKDNKMKFIDQLTSLKNRNYLNEYINNWNNNTVYPQTMIVIDLNNIQFINDTLGYEEGDKQIKAAANILIKTQLNNSDIMRTDGNEFLIYLVGFTQKQVTNYIHKLNKEFKKLPYEYGAEFGYSMIFDNVKTIEDAILEATDEMKSQKKKSEDKMREKIKRGASNFFKIITKPEMEILPGHLAFSFVISIVPTLTILTYIASIFHFDLHFINDFISQAFSQEFADMLLGVNMVIKADWNFFLTLIIAYIIASNGAASVIASSNMIYGIKNSSFFKRRLKSLFMILIIILLFVFLLIFSVFGNKIIEMLQLMDISEKIITNITLIISVLKGPISWFIIFFFIKIIFTMAPDKKIKSNEVNKGAIFTTIGFVVITYIYSIYTTNFANYDVFYGNLASIVVLMIWLYLLSYVFTIGLALNYREEVIILEKTQKLNTVEK